MLHVQAQCFVYADDIVVVDSLLVAVEEWSEEHHRRGLAINPGKSKIMQVGGRRRSSGLYVKDTNWSKLISSNTWVLFPVGMGRWTRKSCIECAKLSRFFSGGQAIGEQSGEASYF